MIIHQLSPQQAVHVAALRKAAERRKGRARAQRQLVIASLLRCPDRPGRS
jgi:hypothetical protein